MPTIEDGVKKVRERFWDKFTTAILTAFGVIVALAWNDATKSFFEKYFSPDNTIFAKCIYALFVTMILVMLSLRFSKEEDVKEGAEKKP